MKKALAFYGAFNPPTRAHVDLAKLAMKMTGREAVIFVPSKTDYILDVQKKTFCFSEKERVDMLEEICADDPCLWYSVHDLKHVPQPRTYDSLREIREMGEYDPSLLIGADQLMNMASGWLHVPEIAREFGIVCLTRSAVSIQAVLSSSDFYKDIAPYVQVVEAPNAYRWISSTDARASLHIIEERLASLRKVLPAPVYDYIKENYLYET